MILPYTYAAGRLAEERRQEGTRDREHARLMRIASPVRLRSRDRILARIGVWLVSAGERLEVREVPVGKRLGQSA